METTRPNYTVIRKHAPHAWWIAVFFLSFCSLVTGAYFYLHIPAKMNAEAKDDLLARVSSIAILTNGSDLMALNGSSTDLTSDSYNRIKNSLYDLHDLNNGARFLYYMRQSPVPGKLMFLADSENTTSKYYSPPGQIYNDTSELEMNNYNNAVTFIEGPYKDAWGTWVSAYAPVWYQGKMIGIFGMDVDAQKWAENENKYQIGIIQISSLIAAVFLLIGIYLKRLTNSIHIDTH